MAFGFLTNTEARERIESLEARITELESDAVARDTELSSARQEVADHAATVAERDATIAEREATIEGLNSRITELESENARIPDLEAAANHTTEQVSIEAARLLAATGADTPLENPEAGNDASKELTREEFRKLAPAARLAFTRNGGKII